MTNEDKKQPGDRRIDADTWNSIIDMLKAWKRSKFNQEQGGFFGKVNPCLTILAGNITPTTYSTSFKVLKLTNTPITVTTQNKLQVNKRPAMQVDIPDSATNAICITQSPAPSEDEDPDQFAYVLAAVLGITLAYVRINDESDLFAVPIAGNVDFLDSAAAGQVRIIEVLDEMQEESGVSGFMPVSGLDESGSGPFDLVKLCIVNIIGGGEGGGTGTATGGCGLVGLTPSDSIRITNSFDGSTHYGTNTGAGEWTSDDNLDYPLGSGLLVYKYVAATGVETLTLDGKLLKPCGNGCWMGGPQTEHSSTGESGSSGSGSGSGPCRGEKFTVCISCACRTIDGWEGPGWYCVKEADTSNPCVATELLEADKCNESIEICSGPYATEEDATVECSDGLTCETAIIASYGTILNVTVPPTTTLNYRLDSAGAGVHSWDFLATDDSLDTCIFVGFTADSPCTAHTNNPVVFGSDIGHYTFGNITFSPASLVMQINNGDSIPHTFQFRFNNAA